MILMMRKLSICCCISYELLINETSRKSDGMFFKRKEKKINIYAPVDGTIIPITEVRDEVFSSKSMGNGVAIDPTNEMIYSPADGQIVMVFPTKHAFGMKLKNGMEIMIHLGIDTVELDGKYYELNIRENQYVTAGDLIGRMDLEAIKKSGYDSTAMVIILNDNQKAYSICDQRKSILHNQLLIDVS